MWYSILFFFQTDTSGSASKSQQNVITIEPLPPGVNGEVSQVVSANGEMSDTSDSHNPGAGNTNRPAVNGPSDVQPAAANPIQVAVTIEPTPTPRTNESSSGQSDHSVTTDKTSAATEGDTQGAYFIRHRPVLCSPHYKIYLEKCR